MSRAATNITLQQLAATPAGQRPENAHLFVDGSTVSVPKTKHNTDKYSNQKVELDGIKFDSKKEVRRYVELRRLLAAGEITHLNCHVPFKLSVCTYEADFTYLKNGVLVVEDVKSVATKKNRAYRMKNKLMKAELNIEIVEI